MNIFECAIIKNMVGGGGASTETLERIEALEKRVEALEPGPQLFDNTKNPHDNGRGVMDSYCPEDMRQITLKECCPDLEVGKTYTMSFVMSMDMSQAEEVTTRAAVWYPGGTWYSAPYSGGDTNGSFTFTFGSEDDMVEFAGARGIDSEGFDCDITTSFTYIMVNEGTEPLPWEPYEG